MNIKLKELGNIESSVDYLLKFNIPKEARILDVGCNLGSLLNKISQLGYKDIKGIDINKEAITEGKKNYPGLSERLSYYDGDKLPFKNNSFDVILMFDVIEHIPNVQTFMKKEIMRVLKTDGLLIFQTPNKYINILWEIINQKSFTKWRSFHCSLQTKRSLKKLLINTGFKSVKIEKNTILTAHNKTKVKRKLGAMGVSFLYLLQFMPLSLFPNLWGNATK